MKFTFQEYLADFEKEEKAKFMKTRKIPSSRVKDSIPGGIIHVRAINRLHKFIEELHKRNDDERLYAKMLQLEMEYARKEELMELNAKIEAKTGRPAGGYYTLDEIGKVFGISRERARQIEQSAIGRYNKDEGHNVGGKLTTPHSSRKLREYIDKE